MADTQSRPSQAAAPEQQAGQAVQAAQALRGLALLLLLQAAGEGLAHAAALPFPGPVVGLLLLLGALRWPPLRAPVAAAAELLLAHLSLLFVPVGVGVIVYLQLLTQFGLQLLAVIVLSTWLGLATTAVLLRLLLRRLPQRRAKAGRGRAP